MTSETANPASAAARTGSGNDVCFEDKQFPSTASQNTQIKFQDDPADFDAEIARALVASSWRASACLLTHAALLIEAGDCLSAEFNRQRARAQFIEANDLFRLFQEVQRVAGIVAEEFR